VGDGIEVVARSVRFPATHSYLSTGSKVCTCWVVIPATPQAIR
jgi:hypothetical protein